ncbi:hypothetical protein [Pseudomonas sp. Ant30-3]|uniref:hypothetical protein n=1 Tax=Pseudomonas sp. Ant30-3 TaxID=1488328 RepID=UPI00048A77C8|nr:hypothetical protein [Pseudomonas sp. Ant30-3]
MMKFKKTITNPMTVIAIFATLSETSAAISLPFLDNEERQTYIWFLISFPFYLIFLFFITLNFNYRSLYAPSDFEKGKHFIRVMDNDRLEHGSSKTFTGQQRHQRPDIIEDPPEPHGVRNYPCTRQLVRLPVPFKDLHIIDTRGKNRKIDLRDLRAEHQREKSETARVIVFLTARDPEKLLKSCVPELTENARRRCSSVFCVAYNVISHEMKVMAGAWPSATEEPAPAQQE